MDQLSPLENRIMQILWAKGPLTAGEVREELGDASLADSTVRTLLRRIESKGYLVRDDADRAHRYAPAVGRSTAVGRVMRELLARYCDGSVRELLVGMVDTGLVRPEELRDLSSELSDEPPDSGVDR